MQRTERISVFEHDSLIEVAEAFVASHRLDTAMVSRLHRLLQMQKDSVLAESKN